MLNKQLKGTISEHLVAGQSLGGLAALFASLHYPQLFKKVISLSGSFWWPQESRVREKQTQPLTTAAQGGLVEQINSAKLSAKHVQLYQTVGYGESDMFIDNEQLCLAVQQVGGEVSFHKLFGGHDWLSWRGALMDGLKHLLPMHHPDS